MQDSRSENPEQLPDRTSSLAPLPPIKYAEDLSEFQRDFIDFMAIAIESEPSLEPFRARFSRYTQPESDQRRLSRWERLEGWRWLITKVIADYEEQKDLEGLD
jgi:hypothetical protein